MTNHTLQMKQICWLFMEEDYSIFELRTMFEVKYDYVLRAIKKYKPLYGKKEVI